MSKLNIKGSPIAMAALKHFANLLSIARKEKQITIDDLCSRVGVSKPTLLKILKGDSSVSIGHYFETAWVLGIPLFEPDEKQFTEKRKSIEKIEALLPLRVREQKVVLDDNF